MDNVRKDRQLADIIKRTHAKLRESVMTSIEDPEEIWRKHVEGLIQNDTSEYARAMSLLSNHFWKNESRLTWISEKLNLYFIDKDRLRFRNRIQRRIGPSLASVETGETSSEIFNVLDVGACHNPLRNHLGKAFEIFPMDLSPAVDDVFRGDFLQLDIGGNSIVDNMLVKALKEASFDAVIFCLLLEYLPCPKLRLKAIKNAVRLLKPFGLLLIVTPDSSHQGKNLNQMKSWRLALADLGMLRIYVEKLKHVHCIGFVKVEPRGQYQEVFTKEVASILSKLKESCDKESAFYIPQDSN